MQHSTLLLSYQSDERALGLPFREILPESEIQQAIDDLQIKYRRRLFDPFVTLWVFLSQMLDVDKSCENAVSRVTAWLASERAEIPSTDTSAYCKARKRLPEKLLERLFISVAEKLQHKVMPEQLWCGRHIKVIDGSTVSISDTIENQKVYPIAVQPKIWLWVSHR